jgi:hypothetical protein
MAIYRQLRRLFTSWRFTSCLPTIRTLWRESDIGGFENSDFRDFMPRQLKEMLNGL